MVSKQRTQSAAIESGRAEARRGAADIVVHGVNGQIQTKDSFGNNTFPPDG